MTLTKIRRAFRRGMSLFRQLNWIWKGSGRGAGRSHGTAREKEAIERRMFKFIAECKCPGVADCVAVLRAEPALARRTWTAVKCCTSYNLIAKHKRSMGR